MPNDNQSFTPEDFSYEMFDRQIQTFLGMWRIVIDGWDDYATQEMTFDIMSLSAKAARLCVLTDIDMSLQITDITDTRRQRNIEYYAALENLMGGDIANLMVKAVKSMRTTGRLEGRRWPKPVTTVVTMLSQFDSFDVVDGSGENCFGELGETYIIHKVNRYSSFVIP